jgi:hypothetical protein
MPHVLFGNVDADAAGLLEAGLSVLPGSERERLVAGVHHAQNALVAACLRAGFESGRVTPVCPDTVEELAHPTHLRFRIHDDPTEEEL